MDLDGPEPTAKRLDGTEMATETTSPGYTIIRYATDLRDHTIEMACCDRCWTLTPTERADDHQAWHARRNEEIDILIEAVHQTWHAAGLPHPH